MSEFVSPFNYHRTYLAGLHFSLLQQPILSLSRSSPLFLLYHLSQVFLEPQCQATSLETPSVQDEVIPWVHDLPSSLAQFFTRLLGHAMMHLSMVGFPARGDCFNSVHMRAIHCKVFPRPISSAIMQPYWFSTVIPVVHLYKNCYFVSK